MRASNQAASRSRYIDLEDRSELTPKGAQEAGRDHLPSRVPYIPFPIDGENAGFVRHVRRCRIERRDPLQALVDEICDELILAGSLLRPRYSPTPAGASPNRASDATFLIETTVRQWNSRKTTSSDISLYRTHDGNVFPMANGPFFVPIAWQYSDSAQNCPCSWRHPLRQTEAATFVQDLANFALNQSLLCLSRPRSSNWGARGQGHVAPGPFFFSGSVGRRNDTFHNGNRYAISGVRSPNPELQSSAASESTDSWVIGLARREMTSSAPVGVANRLWLRSHPQCPGQECFASMMATGMNLRGIFCGCPSALRCNLPDRATHDRIRKSDLPTSVDRPLSHIAGNVFTTS